jgi:hypothetical protein
MAKRLTRAELEMMDSIISHQIDLFRVDASVRARVLSLIDALGGDLETKLARHGITEFQKTQFTRLLADASRTIDAYYNVIHKEVTGVLSGIVKMETQPFIFSSILEAALPSERTISAMMRDTSILGAPNADWWARQAGDTKWRFSTEVRQGLLAGEDRGAIARRVRDTLEVSGANAEALVRTSVQTVSNEARMETYKENADVVIGVRQLSTLDGRTTDVCIAYADGEWDLEGNPINGTTLPFNGGPPRHWNCRSVLVPILDTTDALGFDIAGGTTRSAEGEAVSANMSFDAWLSRRTPEQQDEQLGRGRAELYRAGKITLRDLLNQSGNPLSLHALEKKVSRRGKR